MSYSSQASLAKSQARDILRTQMAMRVQARLKNAQNELAYTVRNAANTLAAFDQKTAAYTAEPVADTSAARASLDTLGLTDDEKTAIIAEYDKADAQAQEAQADVIAKGAERRAELVKISQADIATAREVVEHHQANLTKVDSGEIKVDREELEVLAAKLIADGRVATGEIAEETTTEESV